MGRMSPQERRKFIFFVYSYWNCYKSPALSLNQDTKRRRTKIEGDRETMPGGMSFTGCFWGKWPRAPWGSSQRPERKGCYTPQGTLALCRAQSRLWRVWRRWVTWGQRQCPRTPTSKERTQRACTSRASLWNRMSPGTVLPHGGALWAGL